MDRAAGLLTYAANEARARNAYELGHALTCLAGDVRVCQKILDQHDHMARCRSMAQMQMLASEVPAA